jgi:hypothetical protein
MEMSESFRSIFIPRRDYGMCIKIQKRTPKAAATFIKTETSNGQTNPASIS